MEGTARAREGKEKERRRKLKVFCINNVSYISWYLSIFANHSCFHPYTASPGLCECGCTNVNVLIHHLEALWLWLKRNRPQFSPDKIELVLEVALPLLKLLHSLGVLLDFSFCSVSRWQLWPGDPLQGFVLYASCPLSSIRKPFRWSLTSWSPYDWLLQWGLYRAVPEAIEGQM